MSATAPNFEYKPENKVMLKVKRNTKRKSNPILINTLTPNFEYTNAQNLTVKPNSLLKI